MRLCEKETQRRASSDHQRLSNFRSSIASHLYLVAPDVLEAAITPLEVQVAGDITLWSFLGWNLPGVRNDRLWCLRMQAPSLVVFDGLEHKRNFVDLTFCASSTCRSYLTKQKNLYPPMIANFGAVTPEQ